MLRLRLCPAPASGWGWSGTTSGAEDGGGIGAGGRGSATAAASAVPSRVRVTACTQPLYGFQRLRSEHRYILEDWIRYHHDFFGLDFQIYDIDGSFGHGLGKNFAPFVRYLPAWPRSISPALQELSTAGLPLASEAFAYTHCLATQRARGHAAILLHTPDTYLRLTPGAHFEELMGRMSAQLGGWQYVQHISIPVKNFARSLRGWATRRKLAETRPFWQHGSVVATSSRGYVALEWGFRAVPLLNPAHCAGSDAHGCSLTPGLREAACGSRGQVGDVWGWRCNPAPRSVRSELLAHHYVEVFSWDAGRCSRMFHQMSPLETKTVPRHDLHCGHDDPSLLWLPEYLAAAANSSPAGGPIYGPLKRPTPDMQRPKPWPRQMATSG